MLETDFKRSTPIYFTRRLEGLRQAQELEYRNGWIIARWQAAVMLSPWSKQPITPQQLITFDWEKKEMLTITEAVEKYRSIFDKLTP